ncbi:VPLPA-CTERM sorting domain-containing protein [Thiohalobacter sp. IOR34]|uniref:VPLPA-CTERM sorting domain-containing protein n=1 Tax=Thiohalobacter sp. IOR34 TaxID=3057176 RepID=UPI0025AF393B|nr:VPLPA-CTERM sorting domain-containing protein [Thiohalobacter sp. IOR34]WJW74487.1 VPLPA-CTERM sorting domain-containing protein [Thiohalobacter sp. IOR34]
MHYNSAPSKAWSAGESSKMNRTKGNIILAWLGGLALLCLTAGAQAAPLNLVTSWPDIQANDLDVSYTAATGSLSVQPSVTLLMDYSQDGTAFTAISNPGLSLSATVDASGSLSGGSFSISGDGTTLLSGTLLDFGYATLEGFATFEFLLNVDGGTLASDYGSRAGMILGGLAQGFSGDFSQDFAINGMMGDTKMVVPVPAALWLFGSGLLGLVGVMRRSAG